MVGRLNWWMRFGFTFFWMFLAVFAEAAEWKAWVGSKFVGTPEPPLPFVSEPIWEKLSVKKPLEMKRLPGSQSKLVYADHREEKGVISSMWIFNNETAVMKKVEALSLANRLIYGFCFHPKFLENGFVFTHTNGPRRGEGSDNKNCRVSRWKMDRKTLEIDPKSEVKIIEWESNGHDGGGVVFGLDGMLYITTGDGTADSDVKVTGQRIDLLLSKLLRIDVDDPDDDREYSIPPDNPFLKTSKARPETWAHGFRNPWRVTVDTKTGHVWVGENGQDLWESVKWIERGANYGWSKYEGSHPFYLERKLGPGKLTKPTFEHHHREARSLTGGIVYYGKQILALNGHYIYGDYATGKIWAGKHDGKKVVTHREIADTPFAITGFAEDHHGNLIVIDDHSAFHRLVPNPNAKKSSAFPRKLSQTGLFVNAAKHVMAEGIVEYSVTAPHWADAAESRHFIALPDKAKLKFSANRGWDADEGATLVQTLTHAGKRIETRILLKQQKEWIGYSYEWNVAQTDATLAPREGARRELADGKPWQIPARAECMMCHSRAAKYTLSLTALQMNRDHDFGNEPENQIEWLKKTKLLTGVKLTKETMTDPRDEAAPLEKRVRAYWQVNCSHCHIEAGGGNAKMELEWSRKLADTVTLNAQPVHTRFGLGDKARIIAPANPAQSVMLQRIIRPGPGRMPPVGALSPDPKWIALFTKWVSEMKAEKE